MALFGHERVGRLRAGCDATGNERDQVRREQRRGHRDEKCERRHSGISRHSKAARDMRPDGATDHEPEWDTGRYTERGDGARLPRDSGGDLTAGETKSP